MAIIELHDLHKTYRVHQKKEGLLASLTGLVRRTYKTVRAVDGISATIEAGEMVGFLGPNGAGKTTTLKMLSGLIFPTSGDARVLGYVPWERHNEYRRQFALVMGQKNQLWWDLPAADSFRLHQEIYAIPDAQYRATLGELTELLGVGGLVSQPVRELSLGERMKMELIAALLHSPKVLFLDEPTIGLDVVSQSNIRACLREYNRDKGITVLLTSHYMQDVEALCRRVVVINHGRLVFDGLLSEILERFSRHKIIKLRFHDGQMPERFDAFGEVLELSPPTVTLKVERAEVARLTGRMLAEHAVDDVAVEEIPIEEVIGEVFSTPVPQAEPA
ncbi:MAG TPA: ABC transporter ATP-binding protein [Phycisphaerae bacterium]|nr:ABC transporter ATP-binding protein [Phycisphaerales bacterium]HRX87713.1 ABC transporter ATP-binding protein [Phycisphaerae bacterium]